MSKMHFSRKHGNRLVVLVLVLVGLASSSVLPSHAGRGPGRSALADTMYPSSELKIQPGGSSATTAASAAAIDCDRFGSYGPFAAFCFIGAPTPRCKSDHVLAVGRSLDNVETIDVLEGHCFDGPGGTREVACPANSNYDYCLLNENDGAGNHVYFGVTLVPDCQTSLISGSGADFMKVCVSDDGNLVQFESPAGFPHIGLGEQHEGYFLCSLGGSTHHGYDAGLTESGFGPPTITAQPNGPNTFPLTITRTTLDGVFELTQRFSFGNPKKQVIIGMTVKNVSAAAVEDVSLGRYFDGNIDGDAGDDRYARVADSVWGWEDGLGHGLMQSALTLGTPHSMLVESFADWDGATAAACGGAPQTTPTTPGDFVGRLTYNLGRIKAGKSTTVEALYRRF